MAAAFERMFEVERHEQNKFRHERITIKIIRTDEKSSFLRL